MPERMLLVIFPIFIEFSNAENICNIKVPIGQWLKNNMETSCDKVIGNFILDETATNFTREIFSTFRKLKRIEGCLYVKGFNGSRNLSFFSRLEDVVCKKAQATASNLTNVIYVMEPYLDTMGFNSLKKVTGPGEIILSYEEIQKSYYSYYDTILPDEVQCFTKKEMLFLTRHPQFNGKMYQPCEIEDPCFRLEYFKRFNLWLVPGVRKRVYWHYSLTDIPSNCTTFVGLICIIGSYDQSDPIFKKFKNLTTLIGQIHVVGTFLDNLSSIFPKLQYMYPYDLPEQNLPTPSGCNTYSTPIAGRNNGTVIGKALQIVRVEVNRFLTSMSIPSLKPIRPVDVSHANYAISLSNWINYPNYFPDMARLCGDFPQFSPQNCGRFINNRTGYYEENYNATDDFAYFVWILAIILTAIGIVFSLRSIIILFPNVYLPYSLWLIVFCLLISILAAIERCLMYQEFFKFFGWSGPPQLFATFVSPHLSLPLFQFIIQMITACKHVCLVVIICCYLDLAVFYRLKRLKISLILCISIAILAAILGIFLHSQLFVAIRGQKPNYSREPRHVIFMPFVINSADIINLNRVFPTRGYIFNVYGELDIGYAKTFTDSNLSMEIHGKTFQDFVYWCDVFMVLLTALFHSLHCIGFIKPHNNFIVLIFLYLQLSSNRLRYYIYEMLSTDYCLRKDMRKYENITHSNVYSFNCYYSYETQLGRRGPIMEEYEWKIVLKVIEKIPYIIYPLVSWICWKFARYESYLRIALRNREERSKQLTITGQETASDAVTFNS